MKLFLFFTYKKDFFMILSVLQYVLRPVFGEFEKEEFKKFLRMGTIFALIIGVYWTLRPLKDSVFINLVDKGHIPWAKTASILVLLPLVMLYTRLLDNFSREKMFYILAAAYSSLTLVLAVFLFYFQADAATIATYSGFEYYFVKFLGYVIYVFVESYGSLVVALFWAFATDITESASARKGFYLVTCIGQMGAIFGPAFISSLPERLGHSTSTISFMICAVLIMAFGIAIRSFVAVTPKHLLASFHGKNEKAEEKEQEPGFLEGLKLLVSHKYLLALFAAVASYEIIVTIVDFNFKFLAATHYSGRALDSYLGSYGTWVNIISFFCLLFGVSNITRYLGVHVALAMMPIIVGVAFGIFLTNDTLGFLFWLMVGAKAINYALNGPALKQLYIPTTHDVRFKSQAWIETFGSRGSKEAGSIFNMSLKPLQGAFGEIAGKSYYIFIAGFLGFGVVFGWFIVALYLGKVYNKAIAEKRVIC
jgi:AAA family ATP:ADP antiporter